MPKFILSAHDDHHLTRRDNLAWTTFTWHLSAQLNDGTPIETDGRKDKLGIKRAGCISIGIGLVVMFLLAIAMFSFPKAIIGIYLNPNDPANAEIIALAVPILRIASLSQILDAVQKITYGALQGLQDTRIPVLLNISAFWGVGLSTGYVLGFHFHLGGVGLWLGQSIGVAVAGVLFLLRFRNYMINKSL